MPQKLLVYLIAVACLGTTQVNAQFYNTKVEAKIVVNSSNGLLDIRGNANNLTDLNQSLRYVLRVFSKDEAGNQSKNSQEDRFVLAPSERKELAQISMNIAESKDVILLLLIYDGEDKLLGKERIVLSETQVNNKDSQAGDILTQSEAPIEDFAIRGIVTEDTKTKAGRDFYRMFFSQYNLSGINGAKVVSIKEQFSLGRSTKIEVYVDNQLVFQFFAQPKEDYLKQASQTALYYVSNYFNNLKKKNQAITSY